MTTNNVGQETFEPGDIAYLKSGSPRLTVEGTGIDGKVKVTWVTDGGSTVKSALFPGVCLTKIEPRKYA